MEHFLRSSLNERSRLCRGKLIPQIAAELVLQFTLKPSVTEPVFWPRMEEPICCTGLQQVVHGQVDTGTTIDTLIQPLSLP